MSVIQTLTKPIFIDKINRANLHCRNKQIRLNFCKKSDFILKFKYTC